MTVDADLLNLAALTGWMDRRGLGSGPIEGLRRLSGGTQNVLVTFRRDGREYVLRRGPHHLRARSNQNIGRESTVLTALGATDVPHPRLIAACDDPDVLDGAVFYLMEPVDGDNASITLTDRARSDAGLRHRMGLAQAQTLATLGMVDHVAVGLADYGKPEGFLERQVPRWLAELDSFAQQEGYDQPRIPGLARVADWLERNRPEQSRAGILHGDYHVGNVMYAPGRAEIVAVVDWEMSTIGDPLLDLGALIAVWPEKDGEGDLIRSALADAGGLPTEAGLVDAYAQRSDRDLRALDWYVVLAAFKLGIVLEGTYARSKAGKADRATGDRLHETTLVLFDRALRRSGG